MTEICSELMIGIDWTFDVILCLMPGCLVHCKNESNRYKQLCDTFIHWNFSMTFEFDRQTIKDTSQSDCYDVDDKTGEKAGGI